MKSLVVLLVCLCIAPAFAQVHVRSNTTKKGTYRQAHSRTAPNSTQRDNYSSKGNTNPYTGKRGSKRVTH